MQDSALLVHKRELLFSGGKYEPLSKPETFLKQPLKFDGWPKPKFNQVSSGTYVDSEGEEEDGDDGGGGDEGDCEEDEGDE